MTEVKFLPGVVKDDAAVAVGQYTDTDKIRFVRGQPQTIGGRELASPDILVGLARGSHTWADNQQNTFAAFGTSKRLYVMDANGTTTDITPVLSRSVLTNPFTTTSASTTVGVAFTSHGLIEGQKVSFSGATAVGGLTINGSYSVNASPATNSFEITASTAATSTAGPGGGSVETTVFIAPGLDTSIGGIGYGTGGYGSGGYSGSTTASSLVARTWALDNWGQNLIANPSGSSIYEWAPNVTTTELVNNGDFGSGSTSWSLGAGWSVAGNAAVSTASSSTSITQTSITLPVNSWNLLKYSITSYTSGGAIGQVNFVNVGTERQSTAVSWSAFFSAGGATTIGIKSSALSATIDNISLTTLTYANVITNAPTQCAWAFVTAERILVAAGNNLTGTFLPLNVSWSDQENNQTWTASPANFAGTYPLSTGSRIVRGIKAKMQNLIFTDTGVVSMRYSPDPDVVYSFTEIGVGCGLIGPLAVAEFNGGAAWMSSSGRFYSWSGAVPTPIPCPVERYVFDNLAYGQANKITCDHLAKYSEVWWYYPDQKDGTECSRYVVWNYVDNTWAVGTTTFTAFHDAGVFQYPLSVDTSGQIWFNEKGNSVNGGNLAWSLTTGAINPTGQIQINGGVIQSDDLLGGFSVTANQTVRNMDGIQTRIYGPYNVTASTGFIPMRIAGGEVSLTISGNTAPMFFRLNQINLDLKPLERRR